MQVADAYSMAYPQADKNKIIPIVTTVAVHVLILCGIAMSTGIVPALKPERPFEVLPFRELPVQPPLPRAPLEKIEPHPFEVLPLQLDPPIIQSELEVGPSEKTTKVTNVGDAVILPPSPVTTGARLLQSSDPFYPSVSRIKGEAGTVIVRIAITPYGTVGGVEVEKSSGYPRLDEAALKAARLWRFAPAKRGSEAIASSMLVPVRFEMK